MESRATITHRLDTRQIAVGILHLNLGHAVMDFPGSTRAHPSRWAVVSLSAKGPLESQFRRYFPFQVIWHLWELVVVPVLQDPEYQVITRTGSLRNQINDQSLELRDYNTLLGKIEEGIVLQMQVVGILPADEVTLPPPSEEAHEETGGGTGLPDGDLRWPEGHFRLVYPVVT